MIAPVYVAINQTCRIEQYFLVHQELENPPTASVVFELNLKNDNMDAYEYYDPSINSSISKRSSSGVYIQNEAMQKRHVSTPQDRSVR